MWRRLGAVAGIAGPVATGGLLGVFASDAFASSNGIVQRIAVTLPLAMLAAVAVRLLAVSR